MTAPSEHDIRHLDCETGLRIAAHTTVPLWAGEQLDYGLAVDALLGLDGAPHP